MPHLKISVNLSALELPLRRALDEVRRLGVAGVQADATGDLSPNQLSETGRREFRHLLKSRGLELAALHCPLRHGLDTPANLQPRIEHIRKVMGQAYDLGARVVVVSAGRIPEKNDDSRMPFLFESLDSLGRHGDRVGTTLALVSGLEPAEVLRKFLEHFDTAGLGTSFDPANFLMSGLDPYEAVRVLRDKVVHSYARDAGTSGPSRTGREVPLGHGDIDWLSLLGAYEEIGYRGWLTISSRWTEVAGGVAFLRRLIG